MVRRMIEIDSGKCNGCGLCAKACHEGAIGMRAGKAVLLREDYCDGLGDCLPVCPTGAITFVEREAKAYNGAAQTKQWPVQMKLVPIKAPWLDGSDLLIAADCTAFVCGDFHREFMQGRITLVGCPKLDGVDYSIKLTEILKNNEIQSVTVVKMEVPCCGGLEFAVKKALQQSGKILPCNVVTLSVNGQIIGKDRHE